MNLDQLPPDLFLPFMKDHRLLLCKLYRSSKAGDTKIVRSIILNCTDAELQIVLEVLRRIATRQIHLTKAGSEKLVRSKRSALLRRLANKKKYEEIFKYDRPDLVKFLCSFASLYCHLFHLLFNRMCLILEMP